MGKNEGPLCDRCFWAIVCTDDDRAALKGNQCFLFLPELPQKEEKADGEG